MKPLHLFVALSFCSLLNVQSSFAGKKGGWWGPQDLEEKSGVGIFNRLELGFSQPNTKPVFTTKYIITTTNPKNADDVTIDNLKNELKLKVSGWGAVLGMTYPLVRFGEGNAFSLYTAAYFNQYSFTGNGIVGVNDPTNSTLDIQFNGWTLGGPVGIDFKHGADAIYKKTFPTMITLGAGVYPYLTHLDKKYGIVPDYLPKARPYFKAEFGVRAGMAFKLRALVTGKAIFHEFSETTESNGVKMEYNMDISAPSEVMFSLIIMPFASTWPKW